MLYDIVGYKVIQNSNHVNLNSVDSLDYYEIALNCV